MDDTLTIFALNDKGEGEGIFNDKSLFLPFTLPGERVAITPYKRGIYNHTVLKPSLERIAPVCQHFTQCGGCALQHMNARLYADFKRKRITDALSHQGLDPTVVKDVIILPPGKRRRANMDFVKKHDTLFLGFHRYHSHQIIDVTECHTLDPVIVGLLPLLKETLHAILAPFQKGKLFFTVSAVGMDISLEIQGESHLTDEQRTILQNMPLDQHPVARFVFRYRKTMDVLYHTADPYVVFGDIPVAIDAFSFLQATTEADQFFNDFVTQHMPDNVRYVVDLFCGRGTLTFPLARRFPVVGYEYDKLALKALNESAQHTPFIIQTHHRDLFTAPLTALELSPFDAVVINPPRAGSQAQCEMLSTQTHIHTLIYISCNPETFARDSALLVNQGNFHLCHVTGLDQFAFSPHVEVLAVFRRT